MPQRPAEEAEAKAEVEVEDTVNLPGRVRGQCGLEPVLVTPPLPLLLLYPLPPLLQVVEPPTDLRLGR